MGPDKEDAFQGVKRAYALLFSYVVSVIDSLGSSEALALLEKVVQARGHMDGMRLRRRLDISHSGIGAGLIVYGEFLRDSGISFSIIESGPEKVVLRIGRCPVFEASNEDVLDCSFFGERMCRWIFLPMASSVVKAVDPQLKVQLTKYRQFHDGFCLEEIALEVPTESQAC